MHRTTASVHQGVPGFAVGVLPAPGSILPVHARRSCAPRNLLRWTVPLHMRPGTAALRQAFVVHAGVVALFPPRAYGGVICVIPSPVRPLACPVGGAGLLRLLRWWPRGAGGRARLVTHASAQGYLRSRVSAGYRRKAARR